MTRLDFQFTENEYAELEELARLNRSTSSLDLIARPHRDRGKYTKHFHTCGHLRTSGDGDGQPRAESRATPQRAENRRQWLTLAE